MASITGITKAGGDAAYASKTHAHSAGDITSGVLATTRLGAGTASASTFLRGDGTWSAVTSGTTDPEVVRDTIAAALVAGAGISIVVDDPNDTITITIASHTHTSSQISDSTSTGRSLITAADSAAVRAAAGSAQQSSVEGLVTHDGTAGGGTRPSGYFRVRWVGGTARPTNMATGDVWERDA